MIKITRIRIENFRAFDDVEITFNDDSGIFLFSGGNGSGKSNFLNAISWCLYGQTPFHAIGRSDIIVNMFTGPNKDTIVEVEASIDGKAHAYKRVASSGNIGGVLQVMVENDNDWQILDNIESHDAANMLLPKEISHLFIFNGEQIGEIFKANSEKGLHKSMIRITEVDMLNDTVDHLDEVFKRIVREINQDNKAREKLVELTKAQQVAKNRIEQLEINNSELIDKKEDAYANIEKLDKEIEALGAHEEKLEKLKLLKKNQSEIKENLETADLDKKEIIQNHFALALTSDVAEKYTHALEEAENAHEIPPPIASDVTKRIIKSEICICGRHVGENEVKFINKQHEESKEKEELKFLTEGLYVFQDINEKLKEAKSNLVKLEEKINKLNTELIQVERQIKLVDDELDGVNNRNNENPRGTRQSLRETISRIERVVGQNNAEITKYKSALNRVSQEIDKCVTENEGLEELNIYKDITDKLKIAVSAVKDDLIEKTRSKLEKTIAENFFKVLPNTDFDEIGISEDYSITLKSNNSGVTMTPISLSTGQVKVLGLSLVHTLSKNLGYADFPLFVDNLYGDIKETHSKDITDFIDELAKQKQIFVFDLYNSKTQELLGPRSSRIIELQRDGENHKTLLREING